MSSTTDTGVRGMASATGPEIGKRIKALRKGRGWSAQQLADRATELGYPMFRSTIASLETGRKADVPVYDVIVFSAVFDVAPSSLVPGLRGNEYNAGFNDGRESALTDIRVAVEGVKG